MKLQDFLAEFPDQNDLLDSDSRNFGVIIQKDSNLDSSDQFVPTKIETNWSNNTVIIHCDEKE